MDVETAARLLGQSLRLLRAVERLSQEELAEKVRKLGPPWTQAAVSSIEGGNRVLRVDELLAVAQALGIDPGELLAAAVEADTVGALAARLLIARKKTEEEEE